MVAAPVGKGRKSVRKNRKKTQKNYSIRGLLVFVGLLLFLGFSMCALGYVVFLRTVSAQEILAETEDGIVFEEPDPPLHVVVQEMEKKQPAAHLLPRVAIVIDDLGYSQSLGMSFLELPLELTYSFLPFADFSGILERIAFEFRKTVILHLPLEPKSGNWDPGPGTMYLADSLEIREEKLEKCLLAVPHAIGINNHMGSLFTADQEAMDHLTGLLRGRELFFLDSFTTADSKGFEAALEQGIKTARRNVFLDNVLDEAKICKQIESLVEMAEKKGEAIGIGHPHSETLNALANCTEQYLERVDFVSISELLH